MSLTQERSFLFPSAGFCVTSVLDLPDPPEFFLFPHRGPDGSSGHPRPHGARHGLLLQRALRRHLRSRQDGRQFKQEKFDVTVGVDVVVMGCGTPQTTGSPKQQKGGLFLAAFSCVS